MCKLTRPVFSFDSSKLLVVLVTIGLIGFLSFTGNIGINCAEDTLDIQASYWRDLSIPHSDISGLEYRAEFSGGVLTNGFGNARLSLGSFKNDELGNHTRYTYKNCAGCIVLDINGSMLAINCLDKSATQKLYDRLLEKREPSAQ